jgi:transglutaminase-like putative cysteine protease
MIMYKERRVLERVLLRNAEAVFLAGDIMNIEYGYDITVKTDRATPFHVLLDVHPDRRGDIVREGSFELTPPVLATLVCDAFGNRLRRFTARPGETTLSHRGVIRDSGQPDIAAPGARVLDVALLPAETLHFLQGSRYCETDRISAFAWKQFGAMPRDYSLIQAICDFSHRRIAFNYADARATRTAMESLEERKGVCRDYAHLAIALCRALNIPARYVNGYLGDIGVPADPAPMDFSAWLEVYLEGGWYTFDARHNQRRIGRIVIARGRDAADVPMLHSFGLHQLMQFNVVARQIEAAAPVFEASAAA